jgi:hypothetical protein
MNNAQKLNNFINAPSLQTCNSCVENSLFLGDNVGIIPYETVSSEAAFPHDILTA